MSLVGLAISFLLAWLTYLLVENPVRFSRALLGGVHASIALGILLPA